MQDNGNVWRKYRVVPRAYPSHPLICAYFILKEKNHLKIRKKKFPGTKFLGTFGPPPTEKTEKKRQNQGNIGPKSSWEPPFPGILVFFSCAVFLPPIHRTGNKERFRLPGAGGEHFHCTVDPSPGHIR